MRASIAAPRGTWEAITARTEPPSLRWGVRQIRLSGKGEQRPSGFGQHQR
jgi:hypothetical protein